MGTLGGGSDHAYAINAAGQVAGFANIANNAALRAFLWQNGRMTDLGTLGGSASRARGINAAGWVVGEADTPRGVPHAFLWQDGRMTDLGTLGGRVSLAHGVNTAGQVVGEADTSSGERHAFFVWQNGRMVDLGTLGGQDSRATAISDAVQVVGGADTPSGERHAFVWDLSRGMIDLGTLGGPRSQALGINSAGRVVGWSTIPGTGTTRAFLWQPDRGMIDLGALVLAGSGWDLTEASSINDAGQIVGIGYVGGRLHAFLLTPTAPTPPETETTCFLEQTGLCIDGRFRAYWHAHGGLTLNGYPLSGVFRKWLEDGQEYEVQYFERVRMEYHPRAAGTPHEVQLGQFGRRIHRPDPPVAPQAGALYFVETGHNLHDGFREYWQANGGLAQFGLPITEEIEEQLENGKVYTVQYFERARLEYHPENRPPYDVLLGHFGRRILAEAGR